MKLWERYYTPSTIEETVKILAQYAGQARIVAGGTDLLVEMKDGHHDPYPALVDVTFIPELQALHQTENMAIVGAGVTHTQIVKAPFLAAQATCLVESCGVIGGPQVRNVATLGGNVAHALPAADGTISLVAMEAQAEIVKAGQRQWVNLLDLFLGAGDSLLDHSRDMLIQFKFALSGAGEGSAFSRIMRPQGVALPILGCAVWVKLDEAKTHYTAARVCLAPISPTPKRVTEIEKALIGQPAEEKTIQQAIEVALVHVKARTSKYRATAEYRHEMVEVLLRRTLPKATERAKTGQAVPEGIGM